MTCCSLEVIADLTAHGAGIGILPCGVAKSTAAGSLKSIPKVPCYYDEMCLVYRHENRHIKSIQVISDAIKKTLKKG
jgi:DNA-binding transcriptional LysR family regulator